LQRRGGFLYFWKAYLQKGFGKRLRILEMSGYKICKIWKIIDFKIFWFFCRGLFSFYFIGSTQSFLFLCKHRLGPTKMWKIFFRPRIFPFSKKHQKLLFTSLKYITTVYLGIISESFENFGIFIWVPLSPKKYLMCFKGVHIDFCLFSENIGKFCLEEYFS